MSSNQDMVIEKYGDGNREDGRATKSRTSSLEFHYTKKHLKEYITKETRILEVGCGTGHYGMYYADKCKEYVGIDIVPSHIDIFKSKIEQANVNNVSCQIGDATNLENIADESFDVVLCLGPIYHLAPDESKLVFAECKRVCKENGIVAFAYINKIGAYAAACIYDDWRDIYPNEKGNKLVLEMNTDDSQTGLFYYSTPEDMEKVAKQHGFTKLRNLGTEFTITRKIVDDMTDERFELMKPLYDYMTSYESCTGMSNHALLICKKL